MLNLLDKFFKGGGTVIRYVKTFEGNIEYSDNSYMNGDTLDIDELLNEMSNLRRHGYLNQPILLSDFVNMGNIEVNTKLDHLIFDSLYSKDDVKAAMDARYNELSVHDNVANRTRDAAFGRTGLNPDDQVYAPSNLVSVRNVLGTVDYEDLSFVPVIYADLNDVINNYDVKSRPKRHPHKVVDKTVDNETKVVKDVEPKLQENTDAKVSSPLDDTKKKLSNLDKNSKAYRDALNSYLNGVKALNPQARVPSGSQLMSGTNMEMYVFDAKPMPVHKNGKAYNAVLIKARQRRDVDPTARYAGSFVSSKAMSQNRVSHWQAISLTAWNQMLEDNDKPPVSNEELARKRANDEHLMNKKDSIAFRGNIFVDKNAKQPNGRFSYLVNPRPQKIKKSPYYFDIEHERELDEERKHEREIDLNKNKTKYKEF